MPAQVGLGQSAAFDLVFQNLNFGVGSAIRFLNIARAWTGERRLRSAVILNWFEELKQRVPTGRRGTDTCPTWPTLLAWIENNLPDEEGQLLSTYVADCDECREKLALMNAVDDVLKADP